VKQDFSRNIELVARYQELERDRWSAILAVGPAFVNAEILAAGGTYILDAYKRSDPMSLEELRSMDENREIVVLAAKSASKLSAAAGRDIRVCDHMLRHTLGELVVLNTGIVKNLASMYARSAPAIDCTEIEQEGFFGIKRAAERFDVGRGHVFSTYAVWWIRAFMKRYVCNHASDIRIPVHKHDRDRALRKKIEAVSSKKNGSISITDVAESLRENVNDVISAVTPPTARVMYLDAPFRGADSDDRGYSDAHDSFRLPENANEIDDAENLEDVRYVVQDLIRYCELPPRSVQLLQLRYGIDRGEDFNPMTLEEIGAVIGVSKERVRQIENETLQEIRDAAKELQLPYARPGSSITHPGRRFGAKDVLEYLKSNAGKWLSVEDIQSGIRWMTPGSVAACLRWIHSKGQENVHKDHKKWCYSLDPVERSEVHVEHRSRRAYRGSKRSGGRRRGRSR
jgi:RNA polymerase sigma factor (sigma-70 family)